MSWSVLLLAAAAAAVVLVLILKLRGGGRGDLMGPPERKPKPLSHDELDRLTALVGRGEEEEALRQLKSAGYEEASSRRLVWLMAKVAADGD